MEVVGLLGDDWQLLEGSSELFKPLFYARGNFIVQIAWHLILINSQ